MPVLRNLAGALRGWLPEPVKTRLRAIVLKFKLRAARNAVKAPIVASSARRRYAPNPRQVVFVSDVPRAREAKFAHGLRSRGWSVILLHGQGANYDLGRQFDELIRYRDPEDAVRQALRYSPVAYHLFSPSGDLPSTHIVNARPGPTVFDTTDLLEITYLGNPAKIEQVRHAIDMQVHGIRNADGYCARDLQFRFAKRKLGYRHGGRVVFFPEYCWGIAKEPDPIAHGDAVSTIRCVQAGNFGIEKRGEGDWGYLGIAEKFVAAGIGLDLYPNWTHYDRGEMEFAAIFSDYLALAERSALFRLCRPVKADDVVEMLQAYDFGIAIVWAEVMGRRATSFNADLMPYFMASRVFDYLDAALPVALSSGYRLIHAMLRRYGAGIAADAGFMNDIAGRLKPLASIEMKRRAARASHGLAIERHIHRLERFYAQVAADVGISVG